MKIMKDGTVMMELNQASKDKGYTMRANVNPDCIRAIKRWNQESAAAIRAAIHLNDCKAVIRELENAKNRNRHIRELSEHHDKIVYDASGKMIFIFDYKDRKIYALDD